jgi:hypothetical protein
MRYLVTFLVALGLSLGVLWPFPREARGAPAGCATVTMCVAGETDNGICDDANGTDIVLTDVPPGRHTAYITPDQAGRTCTVLVREAVGGTDATLATTIATLTCAGVWRVALEGPADTLWFEVSGAIAAGSITGTLIMCTEGI